MIVLYQRSGADYYLKYSGYAILIIYSYVVRRLQELGRATKIPLYMCFIDLQKAYDSVDREL